MVLQRLSHYPLLTPVCILLSTHLKLFLHVWFSVYWIIWVCKSLILAISAFDVLFLPRAPLCECVLFAFLQRVVFGVDGSLRRDSGSLARVICHFVSCCDLGLFVCLFVLIIMGCSLLLSHFLFIVLILAPGSSLTSQGCLRCGNQGKLYLPGV